MRLPTARTENLLEQNLEKETLIYDLAINKAFNLNETSTIVYKACDGATTFDELKRKYEFTDDLIFLALEELKKNNLLADESYISPFAGINRREVIRRVGLASLVALPVIAGLSAPSAASAASGGANNGVACTSFAASGSAECKSGKCNTTQNSTYSYATGMNSQSSAGLRCCAGDGETVGTYTTYSAATGFCNFAARCCTGTGTEQAFDSFNNRNVCTCAATS